MFNCACHMSYLGLSHTFRYLHVYVFEYCFAWIVEILFFITQSINILTTIYGLYQLKFVSSILSPWLSCFVKLQSVNILFSKFLTMCKSTNDVPLGNFLENVFWRSPPLLISTWIMQKVSLTKPVAAALGL